MNINDQSTPTPATHTIANLKDGAKAIAAIGRLEVKDIEARAVHRLTDAAHRFGWLAAVTLALVFSAVFLSQAALTWLMLRVAPWQAHLIVGVVWAAGAGLLLIPARRAPNVAGLEVRHAESTVAERQIAIEEDRLQRDLASIKHDATLWFGLRPRLARWCR